jgi:hypothetical protein
MILKIVCALFIIFGTLILRGLIYIEGVFEGRLIEDDTRLAILMIALATLILVIV